MKKKLTVDEIRKLELPCELITDSAHRDKIALIAIKEDSACYELHRHNDFIGYFSDSLSCLADTCYLEVEPKGTKYYRCLIRDDDAMLQAWISENETRPHNSIKKYDDYILLDDDGNLIEEATHDTNKEL